MAMTFRGQKIISRQPRVKCQQDPYHLYAWFPFLPPSITNGSHGHWAVKAKAKKAVSVKVGWEFQQHRPKEPLKKARVHFTRYSSKEPDFDNLVASFKPVLDSLVKNGILIDDKSSVIGQPWYLWEKAGVNQGAILVEVIEQ